MQLAKVVGTVVATQKVDSLTGKKLMIVRFLRADSNSNLIHDHEQEAVAVDAVGAGIGELVLIAKGSSARAVFAEPNYAIELVIVGIVDALDL